MAADFDTIFEEETEFAENDYYAVPDPIIIRGKNSSLIILLLTMCEKVLLELDPMI